MATRGDLLDSRGWASRKPLDPPLPPTHEPTYAVVFLDLAGARHGAPRPAQLDCLPLVWTKMEGGPEGLIKRTWLLEDPTMDGPIIYKEQAPALFVPTAYQPGKPPKTPKGRVVPDVEPAEEEWA